MVQTYRNGLPLDQKKEFLIRELQKISAEHFSGGTPICKRVQDEHLGEVSYMTYANIFGSWNNAVTAAGFTPNKPGGQPGQRGPHKVHYDYS